MELMKTLVRQGFRCIHRLLRIDHLNLSVRQLLDFHKPMTTSVPECQVLHVIQSGSPLSYTAPIWYRAVLCLDGQSTYTGEGGRLTEISFCALREVRHYKDRRGQGEEHEFLLIKVVHTQSQDRRFVLIDKSGRENDEVLSLPKSNTAVLVSGGSVPANDSIEIYNNIPLARCGSDSATLLRTLTFDNDDTPSVFHLAVILNELSTHYGGYGMYWHAGMIYEVFKLRHCTSEHLGADITIKGTYLGFIYSALSSAAQVVGLAKKHGMIPMAPITAAEFSERYFTPALAKARLEAEERMRETESRFQKSERARRVAEEECRAIEEERRAIEEECRAIEEECRAIEEGRRVIEEECRAIEEGRRAIEEGCRVIEEECRVAEEECRVAEEKSQVAEEECRVAKEKCRVAEEECRVAEEECRAIEEELRATKDALRAAENALAEERRARQLVEDRLADTDHDR